MTLAIRALLAIVAALLSLYGSLLVSFALIPATRGVGRLRLAVGLTLAAMVTWYVWRRSASPRRRFVTAAAIVVLVLAVPSWGYWHASRHGDLWVRVNDIGLKDENQLYGSVAAAALTFRDSADAPLASGSAGSRMSHPTAGDCRREEREGGAAWERCFDAQSRWLMTWARQVDHATVRVGACRIERVPVRREESSGLWWLWWVPHPHLDNSARTHFTLTLRVDTANCRPADLPSPGGADSR